MCKIIKQYKTKSLNNKIKEHNNIMIAFETFFIFYKLKTLIDLLFILVIKLFKISDFILIFLIQRVCFMYSL